MNTQRPPTIDPIAAARWARQVPQASAWLHEEVARRMEDRLGWIVRQPASWLHWEPLSGGRRIHAALRKRYAQSRCFVHEPLPAHRAAAQEALGLPWWKPGRWLSSAAQEQFGLPDAPVDMVWANMALHMHADPQDLIRQWHQHLAVDGFLMFSCLGPDTVRELRGLYAEAGWPPCGHDLTDMHDWGDMLVHAGFAEPVMDMERITLTFGSPETLLAELRGLGRNLHRQRFPGLRGRQWHGQLQEQIARKLGASDQPGRLQLTFEIVYGHAFKPTPRLAVSAQSSISLQDMRAALSAGRKST